MSFYSRSHLADQTLLQSLATHLRQHDGSTAMLLADLAEADERRLYVPAGYPSMYLFCVHDLHMSEDSAYKRIRAARAAREFPAIFEAVADGRLHLSAVVLLAPHLTSDHFAELLAEAEHQTRAEIELMLARRFPRPDVPTLVKAIVPAVATEGPAVRVVEAATHRLASSEFRQLAPGPVATIPEPSSPTLFATLPPRPRLAPLSPGRFALQVTVSQVTHDKLRYVQALLGHAVPSGDVATVLERALDALVEKLERQKLGKSARTRPRSGDPKGRHVPAEIRRTVWQRDGGRCTFVSACGKRCESTTRLELDHIDPVARGGQASVDRMRLRCRAHNQYEAECAFGAGFMRRKREEAGSRAARAGAQAGALARAEERTQARSEVAEVSASHLDVMPWLRQLGFSAAEAQQGAARCAHMPDAPLEQRVGVAVGSLAPPCVRRAAPSASGPS